MSRDGVSIACFDVLGPNLDPEIVDSFGSEWKKFGWFTDAAIETSAAEYFDVVPPEVLSAVRSALDVGCGSGRWSRYLSKRVSFVESVDPSDAVFSASQLNRDRPNVRVTRASIDAIPFADSSFDFAICLGVIHHLPNPAVALRRVVEKARVGGHVLVYAYYKLDQRGAFYKGLFLLSDWLRRVISKFPGPVKSFTCDFLAFTIYVPLVGLARAVSLFSKKNGLSDDMPLSYYRNKTLREIRTDSLDRFGTSVERRFTHEEFMTLMQQAGLQDVKISPNAPFWHGIGTRVR